MVLTDPRSKARSRRRFLDRHAPVGRKRCCSTLRIFVSERLAHSWAAVDEIVTKIWAAPETLGYVRDSVQRTLRKS
jgi:hypothetical protein